MRIGLSCTTIEPQITHGKIDGIGTYTKNLLEIFTRLGEEVIPFSFPNAPHPLSSAFPQGQFFKWNYSLSTIFSFINPLQTYALKNTIDILHVTDHMLPRVKDIPLIATICDAIMFNPTNLHWQTIRLGNLKKWLRKKTIHWADHYITISQAMVTELVDYIGIHPEKISVIYLGINPWWFNPVSDYEKESLLNKFNLSQKFIFMTGTIQRKKNIPRLIEAYLKLPSDIQEEYPLVISGRAGWGTEESLSAIQKLTEKKKGVWLDYVSLEELRVLFQCATLYLQPSIHEGFGLTLLEAFASKTPILTSNVTALPEIANDAAYLVDPYSVDDIHNALKILLTSPHLREEYIQKGILRVKDFTWEKCAEKTLKVYESVL